MQGVDVDQQAGSDGVERGLEQADVAEVGAVDGSADGDCFSTRRGYATGLRLFAACYGEANLPPFGFAERTLSSAVRSMEGNGKMRWTVARRLSTLTSFFAATASTKH